jgi:hypothetical protein
MEQIMTTVTETGKKLLGAALNLLRTGAEAGLSLAGKAAGAAAGLVKEQAGTLARTAGDKAKTVARDHRQTLLIIAAAVSALALIASLLGLLLGKKK